MPFEKLQKEVISKNLCSRCGTCVGICPVNNIYFDDKLKKYLPKSKDKCLKGCDLCSQFCPGKDAELENFGFGVGPYKEIFLSRISDKSIRKNSTSGGATTNILIQLIKQKTIDGAIVVGYEKPYLSKEIIASTEKEILDAIQSKYMITPMNAIIRDLDKNKKYAIVALPCQILALRKLQKKGLAKNIIFIIGLFCHSTMYFSGTKELIGYSKTKLDDVQSIRYRQGTFPGGFNVNQKFILPLHEKFMRVFDKNILNRCRLCVDHNAVYADIAVADPFPFIDELGTDHKWTAVVVRTEIGKEILAKCNLERKEVTEKNIKLWEKKLSTLQQVYLTQLAYDKKIGKSIPEYNLKLPEVSLMRALILNPLRVHVFRNIMITPKEMIKKILFLK